MQNVTPFLPGILGLGRNPSYKDQKRIELKADKAILESDLRDWGRIEFCKAHGLHLPEIASKTDQEIDEMRARLVKINKELEKNGGGAAPIR